MTINLKIVNLIKRHKIYTNQELYKAINNFNHAQNHLHLEFDHYDLDRFVVEIEHNQLKLGYVSHPGHQVYFDHPEDSNRNYLTYQQSKARAKTATIEFLDSSNVDFMLTRFGPLFNNNGLAVVKAAQELGINLSNSYQGIANCRDKLQAYLQVRDLVPLVDSSYLRWSEINSLPRKYFSYPRVSKPNSKSLGGERVRLSYDQRQLVQHAYDLEPYDFVFNQEFIQSSEDHTFDLRVMVLNGKVRGSFLRVADSSSIVANISKGGCGVPYNIDPLLEQQALAITRRLGLDISGLDFIYNPELEQWQFLEANACPGYFAYDHVLNKNFAQELLDYMLIRMTGQKSKYFLKELTEAELESLRPLTALEAIIREQELLSLEAKEQQQELFNQAQELLQASRKDLQDPALSKDTNLESEALTSPLYTISPTNLESPLHLPNLEDLQQHRELARQEVELAKLSQQASLQENSTLNEAVIFNHQAKNKEDKVIKVPLEQDEALPTKNAPSPEIAALEASFKNLNLTFMQDLEESHPHLEQLHQEQERVQELGKSYHEQQIKEEIQKILPTLNPGVTTAIPGYGNPLLDQSLTEQALAQDLAGLDHKAEVNHLTSQLVNSLAQDHQTLEKIKSTKLDSVPLQPEKIISNFNQKDFEQKSINFNLTQELAPQTELAEISPTLSVKHSTINNGDSSLDIYLQHEQEVNSLGEALLLEQGKEEVKGLKEQTLQTLENSPKKLEASLELQTLEKSLIIKDLPESSYPDYPDIILEEDRELPDSLLATYQELLSETKQDTTDSKFNPKDSPFSTVSTSPYVTNSEDQNEEDLLNQEAKNNTLDPAFAHNLEKEASHQDSVPEHSSTLQEKKEALTHSTSQASMSKKVASSKVEELEALLVEQEVQIAKLKAELEQVRNKGYMSGTDSSSSSQVPQSLENDNQATETQSSILLTEEYRNKLLSPQHSPLLAPEASFLLQDKLSTLVSEKAQELKLPHNQLNGFAQTVEDPRPFVDNTINLVQLYTKDNKSKK